jgi:hypothetical protein
MLGGSLHCLHSHRQPARGGQHPAPHSLHRQLAPSVEWPPNATCQPEAGQCYTRAMPDMRGTTVQVGCWPVPGVGNSATAEHSVFATNGANRSASVTRTSATPTPHPSPRTGPQMDVSGMWSSSWRPCSPSWAPLHGGAEDGPDHQSTTTIRNRRQTWNRVRRCLLLFPWKSSRRTVCTLKVAVMESCIRQLHSYSHSYENHH